MSALVEDWLPRHRLSVDEYYRMADVGLLAPDARVELIDGEIIDMAPIGSAHAGTVDQICAALSFVIGPRGIVGVQRPLRLDARTEPQPDVVLLRARPDFYRRGHPVASDVLLVVEVADPTLRYDRDVKMPLYARHGIPEAWLVDLASRVLHVHRAPQAGSYAQVTAYRMPEGIALACGLPGEVSLKGLFELRSVRRRVSAPRRRPPCRTAPDSSRMQRCSIPLDLG